MNKTPIWFDFFFFFTPDSLIWEQKLDCSCDKKQQFYRLIEMLAAPGKLHSEKVETIYIILGSRAELGVLSKRWAHIL